MYCCHWHFKTFAKCSCLLQGEEIEGALNCIIIPSPRVKEKLHLHSALALLQRQRSGKPRSQPGRGNFSRVWGTGGQTGAQQKPEAFLGQREVTAGKGAEGREAGRLLLQSNRAELHALNSFFFFLFPFDWLLNLPRASYEREGRWQQDGERQ